MQYEGCIPGSHTLGDITEKKTRYFDKLGETHKKIKYKFILVQNSVKFMHFFHYTNFINF